MAETLLVFLLSKTLPTFQSTVKKELLPSPLIQVRFTDSDVNIVTFKFVTPCGPVCARKRVRGGEGGHL